MAVITATNMDGTAPKVVAETTLTASDTLTFNQGKNPLLTLRNASAGALTPNIVGDSAPSAKAFPFIGEQDLSAGYTFPSIGVGEVVTIELNDIRDYLAGSVVTVTSGTDIVATLLEF